MKYLLDTDTCIALIRANPQALGWLAQLMPSEVGVSTISQAELHYGARKSQYVEHNLAVVHSFLKPFDLLPFDVRAAEEYGLIRCDLERLGKPIGPNDLKIAAIARSRDLILVTHNTREFTRVAGLRVVDWLMS